MGKVCEIAKTLKVGNQLRPLGNEAVPTIQAMRTMLEKRNLDFFLSEESAQVDDVFVCRLEKRVFESTESLEGATDNLILRYFNSVQLWGGRTGRNIYVQGGGIEKNLSLEQYRKLAAVCRTGTSTSEIFAATENFLMNTKNIGIAFATKHTRFLTSINPLFRGLPIYDSIIATRLYQQKTVRAAHVIGYWNEMLEVSRKKSCDLIALERAIFNSLRSDG